MKVIHIQFFIGINLYIYIYIDKYKKKSDEQLVPHQR